MNEQRELKCIVPLKVPFEMLRKNENVNSDMAVAASAWGHQVPVVGGMEDRFGLCFRALLDPVVLRQSVLVDLKLNKEWQFSDGSEAKREQGCLSRKPSPSVHLS